MADFSSKFQNPAGQVTRTAGDKIGEGIGKGIGKAADGVGGLFRKKKGGKDQPDKQNGINVETAIEATIPKKGSENDASASLSLSSKVDPHLKPLIEALNLATESGMKYSYTETKVKEKNSAGEDVEREAYKVSFTKPKAGKQVDAGSVDIVIDRAWPTIAKETAETKTQVAAAKMRRDGYITEVQGKVAVIISPE